MAYVYCHIRIDKNEIFYIGIGTDNTFKRAKERARRSVLWKRIVNKTDYKVEILHENLTWEDAKLKEIELIHFYGRKDLETGNLVNMTDGGDGTINKVFNEEYREKLSKAAKKRDHTEAYKRMQEGRKLYKATDELRKKLSAIHKGKPKNENQRNLSSERLLIKNPSKGKKGIYSINYKFDVEIYKNGVIIDTCNGVHETARKYNLSATKISAVLNNKRNHTGGYTFKKKFRN